MLPDGHHFVYVRFSLRLGRGGVYVSSLDTKPAQQSTKHLLLYSATSVVYVPTPVAAGAVAFLLFVRGSTTTNGFRGTLMGQPFDPKRMELAGEAVPSQSRLSATEAFPRPLRVFSVSRPAAPVCVNSTSRSRF
jgi:hypothetical protein